MAFSGKPFGMNPSTGLLEPLTNISGLSNLYFVRVATTASLGASYDSGAKTLTNTGTLAALSIDGVTLSASDKVLVKNQSTGSQNGLYTVTTVGDGATAWVLTRSGDMDTSTEVEERDWFWVTEGTTNADNGYALSTPGTITLDTTSLTFTRMLGSATGSGQPASAALTDLADVGVVSAADKFLYSTGTGVWAEGTVTAAARSILDDPTTAAIKATLGIDSVTDTWSEFSYDAHVDGRANGVGWTEVGATHGTGSTDGITHHAITSTSGISCYISRSLSITSASSWEAQIEMEIVNQSIQSSFIIFDGTRRVFINATSSGLTDFVAGAFTSDINNANSFVTITIRKTGGAAGIVEAWIGPQYLGRKLYTSLGTNATAANMYIGKITTTGASEAHIRKAKFNIITSDNWNSTPNILFAHTIFGR